MNILQRALVIFSLILIGISVDTGCDFQLFVFWYYKAVYWRKKGMILRDSHRYNSQCALHLPKESINIGI